MFSEGQFSTIFGEDFQLVQIEVCFVALNIGRILVCLLQQ